MQRNSRVLAPSIAALFLSALAIPARAQFMGVFQGLSSAVGQVAGKITNRAFAGTGEDLQASRDKFFGQIDAQTAGMDEAAKRQHRALLEKQWSALENVILLKNAQIQREKDGPLVDFKQVAGAAIGGVAVQAGFNNAIAGAGGGMTDMVRSAAMGGIIEGAQTNATAALVDAGAASRITASASDLDFTPDESVHPLKFLGKHPGELHASALYRENGFIGWKRLEASPGAEAYAPITGDGPAKFAIYNFDPQTGQMKASFRVLKVSPAAFSSAVAGYAKTLGAQPRYASAGAVLRAVWENGAFVTADATKLSAGWSSLVPAMYANAPAPSAAR